MKTILSSEERIIIICNIVKEICRIRINFLKTDKKDINKFLNQENKKLYKSNKKVIEGSNNDILDMIKVLTDLQASLILMNFRK